ncbi:MULTISPECIES: sigma-70 family RNA polymerase sigma factor [Sphingomonas]|uniref:RNA polymerase sigma-70 factor (ECF subfamily) n=1 Tax=Sphingomonas trueperi TaxID=53317 RepID=A0A7X5Y598_9SPHN|nr:MULTISPECIES: sigma-70 family RNA polymerase sigma factor [Sphingomonas]NJC00011.1 RNA polymerase sigma-70 factor (ECF subfamily) [Sphingomonas trueperi]
MMLLIEPLIPRLRRYARVLLRDSAAADDLVQDCLERAISRWHQRRADGDARAWLFTILHNLAMNRMRQTARRGAHVQVEDASPAAVARAPDQEAGIHQRDVLQALDRLPDDQRAVLLLVTIEELSYADAAKALGVPIGTVMSRLSRARTRLREEIAGRDQPAVSHLRRVK